MFFQTEHSGFSPVPLILVFLGTIFHCLQIFFQALNFLTGLFNISLRFQKLFLILFRFICFDKISFQRRNCSFSCSNRFLQRRIFPHQLFHLLFRQRIPIRGTAGINQLNTGLSQLLLQLFDFTSQFTDLIFPLFFYNILTAGSINFIDFSVTKRNTICHNISIPAGRCLPDLLKNRL